VDEIDDIIEINRMDGIALKNHWVKVKTLDNIDNMVEINKPGLYLGNIL
jgi:hypothetical protein